MRTHRYDEIRAMQVIHLVSVWLSDKEESATVHKKLDEKIDKYAAGELEYAAGAISSIWDLSRKMETLPSIPQRYQGLRRTKKRETRMQTSLIESIQGGSLLHREYWARRSRGGSACPIYFPNAMSSSMLSRVATCE